MAIYVKPIPTLTGEIARHFNKMARENETNRGSIDFSKQVETAKRILEKSDLYK